MLVVLALAALAETLALSWIQWQNYLGFIPIQGDLGDYNQAFYTASHGLGFFYFTTNIPGGSNGSLWAVHFAPIVLAILPFYAIAPTPVTLLVIKQAALAFAVVPLYLWAKVYFHKETVPLTFGILYLVCPLVLAADWNNFDLEVFLPFALFTSFYFFSRGRLIPFLLTWLVALSVIEAAAPLMILFTAGGLLGTYVVRSSTPYWTEVQQRRPLLIALVLTLGWFAISFVTLILAGARGGGFGDAYATRYEVLGATSFPNVIPQALTHPALAAAALQSHGTLKLTFLAIIVLAVGATWLIAGVRYLLPILAYLIFALLASNPGAYSIGTEQPLLLVGFLFAAALDGTVVLSDWLSGNDPYWRHRAIRHSLVQSARAAATQIKQVHPLSAARSRATLTLGRVTEAFQRDDLGRAEALLDSVRVELTIAGLDRADVRQATAAPGPSDEPPVLPSNPGGRSWRGWSHAGRPTRFVVAGVLILCALPIAVLSSPLLPNPLGGASAVSFGYVGPNSETASLQALLDLIPPRASVLTTSHLYPQLSNRADAFVVPSGRYLPQNQTIANELNQWANRSDYVAIDYNVDPVDAEILRTVTNLSAFGLYAEVNGALLYKRGWTAAPLEFVPFQTTLAGAALNPRQGQAFVTQQYASPFGPALYHPPTPGLNNTIWGGPGLVALPLGEYSANFTLVMQAPHPGPQLSIRITMNPAVVVDTVQLTVGGESYRQASVRVQAQNFTVLNQTKIETFNPYVAPSPMTESIRFALTVTGFLGFPAIELSTTMSAYLISIQLTQLAPVP